MLLVRTLQALCDFGTRLGSRLLLSIACSGYIQLDTASPWTPGRHVGTLSRSF